MLRYMPVKYSAVVNDQVFFDEKLIEEAGCPKCGSDVQKDSHTLSCPCGFNHSVGATVSTITVRDMSRSGTDMVGLKYCGRFGLELDVICSTFNAAKQYAIGTGNPHHFIPVPI